MATKPAHILRLQYEAAARRYLASLPLEHFMEAKPQARQRAITLASLALVESRQPEVQVFNAMLVQYPFGPEETIRQVVPDNMVAVYKKALEVVGSYDVVLQPCKPLWVLEYVSPSSERKDYVESFNKYEQELLIPYYLVFHPERQNLILYKHTGEKYEPLQPNRDGRLVLRRLKLEMALLEGWVRFWHKGELLPLPAELDQALRQEHKLRVVAERQAQDSHLQAVRLAELGRKVRLGQASAEELRELEQLEQQLLPPT